MSEGEAAACARADALRAEGNELLAKGNYADAIQRYQEGLVAVVQCGGEGGDQARLALHLNAALAELRRGNLASSVEHASAAIQVDPQNAKAYYRRGLANKRLADNGHAHEALLARADFERALELEPGNTEVRGQLRALKEADRAGQKELDRSQRETFKGMFSGSKPLYDDPPPNAVAGAPPVFRDEGNGGRRLVLAADNLAFSYAWGEPPVLKGVSLELRAGWCLGLVGNNAEGKTTLARLLLGRKLTPSTGRVVHHGAGGGSANAASAPGWWIVAAALGLAAAVAAGTVAELIPGGSEVRRWADEMQGVHWACVFGVATITALVAKIVWARRVHIGSSHNVLHVSSETADKELIQDNKTIEAVIGERLPKRLSPAERRERVIALLCAAGFQMYNQETSEPVGSPAEYIRDGLRFGRLSGGQRHLIYILSCFASRPDVLLCDELLVGLDAIRQSRVLRMLRRLMKETGTAVLYISTELHQIKVVTDSLAFLNSGCICECGPTDDVLQLPKHPIAKSYIGEYMSLPGCYNIGGKLAEAYAGLKDDAALAADWVPPAA